MHSTAKRCIQEGNGDSLIEGVLCWFVVGGLENRRVRARGVTGYEIVAGEFDIFRPNKKTKKNLFKKYSPTVFQCAGNQENL